MGIFDIFKKKKANIDINCRFNFNKTPELLESYKQYRTFKLKATSLSRKDVKSEVYEEAAKMRDDYGRNVLAKEIWDIFSSKTPTLYNADTEEYIDWEKLFNTNFDQLSEKQKDFLVGLIEGNYIYELPKKYYND